MQNNTPLVTVGIPTYNRPKGLERTLQSILGQTYTNLQVIVSDNCSNDKEVLLILQKYASQDSRVKYVVQEKNLSIVPNFQFLLDSATGEYFMWAADDDDWDANFIEVCVKAMEENKNIALSITDVKIFSENGESRPAKLNRSFMQRSLFRRSYDFVKCGMENKYFLCGLYRTSLVKDMLFPNRWGGEHLFLFELITKGRFLFVQDHANFYYYKGGSSKGTDSIRKAFNIKSRFYFFDAYILKFPFYQFGFKHLSLGEKIALFFCNWAGLIFNEDYILYYILVKKPFKSLLGVFKKKPIGNNL